MNYGKVVRYNNRLNKADDFLKTLCIKEKTIKSARDRHTHEIIEAEELWLPESVDKEGYVCWGCGIEM
ncbi:Uncharacterised protein [Citrobacter youngae]|uniref:Uncharacterized protein n=1 Tax=Citrobacter youngae TaxID=133448 RepID=A0ABN7GHS9_9ENTR|nr:Uncharacterised protein [Citrobacter youngae]CAC9124741.1 Uncharacterised protein [Citrobacter youngae]